MKTIQVLTFVSFVSFVSFVVNRLGRKVVNATQAGTLPISLSTSLAALNASRPAGIPQ
jgi:hypothetical protein